MCQLHNSIRKNVNNNTLYHTPDRQVGVFQCCFRIFVLYPQVKSTPSQAPFIGYLYFLIAGLSGGETSRLR
jgi:hypothetical protein